ncbi:hypothetical protein LCL95_13495 [Bacillus timonensis]|nr:hypothetical protein [Bacillus timonensis]
MAYDHKQVKRALDESIYSDNPFNEQSKEKILQQVTTQHITNRPFSSRWLHLGLTGVVFAIVLFGLSAVILQSFDGGKGPSNQSDLILEKEEKKQKKEEKEKQSENDQKKINEKEEKKETTEKPTEEEKRNVGVKEAEQKDGKEATPSVEYEYIYDGTIAKYMIKEKYDDAVLFKSGQKDKVKKTVSDIHHYLDDLFGYGRIETLDLGRIRGGDLHNSFMENVIEPIAYLRGHGFAPSMVIYDMVNAQGLHYIGDEMAYRYMHRIFHDLDHHLNGEHNGSYTWGITEAYGDPTSVEKYVEGR